jgi:hypothetical protein
MPARVWDQALCATTRSEDIRVLVVAGTLAMAPRPRLVPTSMSACWAFPIVLQMQRAQMFLAPSAAHAALDLPEMEFPAAISTSA